MSKTLIGTDASISECRISGYPVMEINGLMNRGVLDKTKDVRITQSNPENWTDNGRPKRGYKSSELYDVDTWICFNDVWETFENAGEGIKSFCDWENCPIEHENPTEHDMLQVANMVIAYCGLDR